MNPVIYVRIIYVLWIMLAVYLTVSAIGIKRDKNLAKSMVQSFILLFAIIAAFVLPNFPVFRFVNFAPISQAVSIIGTVFCILGMAVVVWGRRSLGKNWSQTVAVKEKPELVTTGAYRWVRHPIYAGGFLAAIASAIVAGGPFVFLLIVLGTIYFRRIGAEDKLMEKQFPDQYPAYQKRTKALIPFVW